MDKESITLFLTIWGASLSTILAVLKIMQDRKDSAIKLFIDCQEVNNNIENFLAVFVSNIWKRPITIIEISLGLGNDKDYQKIIYSHLLDQTIKLEESESFKTEIFKNTIMQKVESFNDEDFMFMKLWLNVKLTSGKVVSKTVYIDPKVYNISTNFRYDEYLATSAFFSRDLIPQYAVHWERKMIYDKK